MAPRVLVQLYVLVSEAAFLVCQRAIDQLLQLLDAECFESENLRARHERTVHVEERIVSGRTDETKVSSFDVGQKDILLGLVEMMNLINKEDRLLPGGAQTITGRGEHTAHFGDVAFHPANPNKFGMGHLRDHARQGGLAAAGRPVENYRGQTISFDCPAQQFARPKNVLLTDKFLERTRPHTRGEWSSAVCSFHIGLFVKQILHEAK